MVRRLLVSLLVLTGFVAVGQITSSGMVAAATGEYQAVNPSRVTDTRDGYKIDDGVSDPKGIRTTGSTLTVPIVGRGGVPKGASAVTLNLTATGSTTQGFLRVYPCGTTPPSSSSLNLQPGVDVANSVFSQLGKDGDICIFSQGNTHVIVDITGYVPAKASPTSLEPTRVTDTRDGYKIDDKVSDPKGARTPGTTLTVPIAGRGGVPKDASAVIINLTATGSTSPGFLRVYPCGTRPASSSSLNLQPGVDVANLVFSKLGKDGDICIFSQGVTHVIVDITGYVPANASPTPVNPARVTDTRDGYSIDDNAADPKGIRTVGTTLTVPIARRGGVPKNASAVIINLTATGTTTEGFLRVYPCGTKPPSSSSLNLRPGVDVANTVFSKLGKKGDICIFSQGNTHVIVDITGHITEGQVNPPTPPPSTTCKINGSAVGTTIPQVECDSLVKLFEATGGSDWAKKAGWNTATDPCSWHGVSCLDGNVTRISLARNKLTGSLPGAIGNFKRLEALDLSYNKLKTVPKRIEDLNQLKQLSVLGNQLETLPSEIGNLKRLKFLSIASNPLGKIPPSIGRITTLTSLNASEIGMTEFPSEVLRLTNLNALYLARNNFKRVPAKIQVLTKLKILEISAIGSGEIPKAVLQLKSLTELGVADNEISSLPDNIDDLTNLKILSLASNRISGLPKAFGKLTKLEDLSLSGNQLKTVPAPIAKLTNLKYLSLSYNKIEGDVTDVFRPLVEADKLTKLFISPNRCIEAKPAVAKWLDGLDKSWRSGCLVVD